MKVSDLFESTITLSADKLRAEAEAAGHKLFDDHSSGLIFSGDIEIISLAEYDQHYDTFEYIFKPEPLDVADDPVRRSHAVDGVIYVAGAHGIKLITLPGITVEVTGKLTAGAEYAEDDPGPMWVLSAGEGRFNTYYVDGRSHVSGPRPLPDDPSKVLQVLADASSKYRSGVHHAIAAARRRGEQVTVRRATPEEQAEHDSRKE